MRGINSGSQIVILALPNAGGYSYNSGQGIGNAVGVGRIYGPRTGYDAFPDDRRRALLLLRNQRRDRNLLCVYCRRGRESLIAIFNVT